MAAIFPHTCSHAKPFLTPSLNITRKSVRIFKTKGIAEMHRFYCMLAHIGSHKTCWPKLLESKHKTACYELSMEICIH